MARDKKKIKQYAQANPYYYFFGNLVDTDTEFDFLNKFRKDILGFLKRASKSIKRKEFSNDDAVGAIAEDRIDLYKHLYTQLVCESFIISCVIFLEQEIKIFSEGLMFTLSLNLNMSDLRGSLLERFKKYCQNMANLNLDFSSKKWQDITAIMEIRNCLVHNSGLIDDFTKINVIKTFAKRYGTPCICEGRLHLSDDTLLITLKILRNFNEKIHDAALRKFPRT